MAALQEATAAVTQGRFITPEDFEKVNSPSTKMALALAATGKRVYEGTVPAAVVARRRAANKRARIARRAAR